MACSWAQNDDGICKQTCSLCMNDETFENGPSIVGHVFWHAKQESYREKLLSSCFPMTANNPCCSKCGLKPQSEDEKREHIIRHNFKIEQIIELLIECFPSLSTNIYTKSLNGHSQDSTDQVAESGNDHIRTVGKWRCMNPECELCKAIRIHNKKKLSKHYKPKERRTDCLYCPKKHRDVVKQQVLHLKGCRQNCLSFLISERRPI